MLSNFAVALATLAISVSAWQQPQQPYGGQGYGGFNFRQAPQLQRSVRREIVRPAPQANFYSSSFQGEQLFAQPRNEQISIIGGYGYEGAENLQPTYAYVKGEGYVIVDMPAEHKKLIGNDGYQVRKRTDPAIRQDVQINAHCVLLDPEDDNDIQGLVQLSQLPKMRGTAIWGEFFNLGDRKDLTLTLNALGDLRDGCDSVGDVFNPSVSKSGAGEGQGKEAPGALGALEGSAFDFVSDVDLAGSQSVIGRSIVLNGADGARLGCCTIGLAAGPSPRMHEPEPEPQQRFSRPQNIYQPTYQPVRYEQFSAPVYQRQPQFQGNQLW